MLGPGDIALVSAISSRVVATDPRVQRTRSAVFAAATLLFLRDGYTATMEAIAARAGVARRSVYNNFRDKDALFTEIVREAIGYAEDFARSLREELGASTTAAAVRRVLNDLGRRLALTILRQEVIALRRLLVSEALTFPGLAKEYFHRAPGQVMRTLAEAFAQLARRGLLRVRDPGRAAEQFAYLVAGALLDRAILVGRVPPRKEIVGCAAEGVRTFLARYGSSEPTRAGLAQ